ncbi:MAG TPA: methyl-accepting chemotaxis protein, partial [Kofleriaceae bacterium]|nr:methyl-accepting chemotaxis protein [Kofleriaceae bacterium]
DRHAYWVKSLEEGTTLHRYLVVDSFNAAEKFFEIRDGKFNKAVRTGDLATARQIERDELKPLYNTHRVAVDGVVKTANEEWERSETDAKSVIKTGTMVMVILGLIVVGVILFIGWLTNRIAKSLTNRIELATQVAATVAGGDLTVTLQTREDDETGRLLAAIKTMTESLNSLVVRVKKSSIELMSTATQFSAASKQQEATVSGFNASTNEIAAAVREISATSQELLSTMEGVNTVAVETANLAEQGKQALGSMDTTMRQLVSSTGSISTKLSAIREKAADINVVVTTITKVADQTNLLSVNAAIEAEKAGEYGLGFIVLAREIRRLADQTAVATLDIEEIIRQMQGAVSAGVMEMDKFTEEVRRGVRSVEGIGGQLGQIITQVQTLSASFESVAEAMRAQSQGAVQINDAMASLTQGARQTAGALREFDNATGHLRDAVDGLKQEISHFKVTN